MYIYNQSFEEKERKMKMYITNLIFAIDLGKANLGGIFESSVGLSQCLERSHSPTAVGFGKKEEETTTTLLLFFFFVSLLLLVLQRLKETKQR